MSLVYNVLEIDEHRMGWVTFPDGPHFSALLERKKNSVTVEIIPSPEEAIPDDILDRPLEGALEKDGVILLFTDRRGSVELVGCAPSKIFTQWGSGTSSAVFTVRYLIFGGNGKTWASIRGLRTIHPSLDVWLHVDNIEQKFLEAAPEGKSWVQYELSDTTEIPLEGYGDLAIFSYPVTENVGFQGVSLSSRTELYSRSEGAFEIAAAFEEHQFFNNLLSILSASQVAPHEFLVHGTDNPIRLYRGEELSEPNWCRLVAIGLQNEVQIPRFHDFLVNYRDVGPEGLKKWIEINREFKEGVDALVRVFSPFSTGWAGRLVDVAIAFEHIGYKLEQEKPKKERRGNLTFYDCIQNICMECPQLLYRRPEKWADALRITYRGVKHANRPNPPLEDIIKTTEVGINVLRIWFCHRLGVAQSIEDHWWNRLALFYPWFWPPAQGDDADERSNWFMGAEDFAHPHRQIEPDSLT